MTLSAALVLSSACHDGRDEAKPPEAGPTAREPERMNQALKDTLRDSAPTLVLDLVVSLKVDDDEQGIAVEDAERQARLAERERRTKVALAAIQGDLLALGAVIQGSLAHRPVLFLQLPAGKVAELLADPRFDRVDLSTEGTRDGTVRLDPPPT